MTYKSMFDEKVKAGKVKTLSAEYVTFDKAGVQIIGKLVGRNKVASQQGAGTYNQYLFETDKGLVKFALGTATDNEAGAMMGKEGVYSITFKGQEDIGRGRKINKFEIIELAPPIEPVVGGGDDVPF